MISSDTTWTLVGSPYIVTGNISVQGTSGDDGVTTLTIEPGVVVRFNSQTQMDIGSASGNPGALNAQGTTDSKILFTSNAVTPSPGIWYGIYINNTADDNKTVIDNCIVEYGGKYVGGWISTNYGNIAVSQASITIQNSIIRKSIGAGISVCVGTVVITNNTITENTRMGVYLANDWYGNTVSSTISGNTISNNGMNGISLIGVHTISYNTMNNNSECDVNININSQVSVTNNVLETGIKFPQGGAVTSCSITGNTIGYNQIWQFNAENLYLLGTILSNNSITNVDANDYIEINGGTITKDTLISNAIQRYHILGSLTVKGTDGSDGVTTLAIEPGTELRFNSGTAVAIGESSSTGIPGSLVAVGTQNLPITFTSASANPLPGDWGGIFFFRSAHSPTAILDHCTIEYGGREFNYQRTNVYLAASIKVQNCIIRNSPYTGIGITSSCSPLISDNTISYCGTSGGYYPLGYGIYSEGGPALVRNTITHSVTHGIYTSYASSITGNTITNSGTYGIELGGWSLPPVVKDNYFSDNGQFDFRANASGELTWTGNTFNTGINVPSGTLTSGFKSNTIRCNNSAFRITPDAVSGVVNNNTFTNTNSESFFLVTAGTISHDATWPSILNYHVTGDVIVYGTDGEDGVTTLTLEPGAKLKFDANGSMRIGNSGNGKLDARGTSENPIYFTSSSSNPAPGDWKGLTFYMDVASYMSHCIVEYGGRPSGYNNFYKLNLNLSHSSVTIENSIIRYSNSSGISYAGGDPQVVRIIGSTISNNAEDGLVQDGPGSWGSFGGPESLCLIGNTISGNGRNGISLNVGSSVIQGNNINGNGTNGIQIMSRDGTVNVPALITGNTLSGNANAGIHFTYSATSSSIVRCNRLLNNLYGISTQNDSHPTIQNNDIYSNTNFGLNNTGTIEVNVDNNWWGDQSGPGGLANAISGTAHFDPWLTSASTCAIPAPAFAGSTPKKDSTSPQLIQAITITIKSAFAAVDDAAVINSIQVRDGASQIIPGSVTEFEDVFTFIPDSQSLTNGTYNVSFTAVDVDGNASNYSFSFTIDAAAPDAPVVNAVISPTNCIRQLITGTKQADTSVLLNDQQIIARNSETAWQYEVTLVPGNNHFVFTTKDLAGNVSQGTAVDIIFEDIAPLAISTVNVNAVGDGVSAALDWTGYNESVHGDISQYLIYVETTDFTSIAGLTSRMTVPAHTFTANVTGLTHDVAYYFAVVARDQNGNVTESVTPVAAIVRDVTKPADVNNLRAVSGQTSLQFTWSPAWSPSGDIAGYRLYFNGATEGVQVPPQNITVSHEVTGLSSSSSYPCRVTAVDTSGNESAGAQITGYTFLSNPTNVSADPNHEYVTLSWPGVEPQANLSGYRVYVSQSNFSSVEGMSPCGYPSTTSFEVHSLENGATYYFAVVSVNRSNGFLKDVTTITATPRADIEGPSISDLKLDGIAFGAGNVITKSGTFTISATDISRISKVEYYMDGVLIGTYYSAPFSAYISIEGLTDGTHTLRITAYDTYGNPTSVDYPVQIQLAPPSAPVISQPSSGLVTNNTDLVVSGTAEKNTSVTIYLGSTPFGAEIPADDSGKFSTHVTLVQGENNIHATAKNRAGEGPSSNNIVVTVDDTVPDAPQSLIAKASPGGTISLSWYRPLNSAVTGYNIYRSSSPFTSISQAVKVNTAPVKTTAYVDLPSPQGTYYYRAVCINAVEVESTLSNEVSATSDSILPNAVSIQYTPHGLYDAATGRYAPGIVDVTVSVSEKLETAPFLSITPLYGTPILISLTRSSDLVYTGIFTITQDTPSGEAFAVFSARDLAGNRGTEIASGGSIKIDSEGPAVSRIELLPGALIKNDQQSPVSVTVTIGLNDHVKQGTSPVLTYLLSQEGRTTVTLDSLTQIATAAGDIETWQAVFTLPADAGLAQVEALRFTGSCTDDMDNTTTRVVQGNFQVYQGDLPPLGIPTGLVAKSLPGGDVQLNWNEVKDAIAYQIYRKTPAETVLSEHLRVTTGLEAVDSPRPDGTYTYAVASILQANGQESKSGMSTPVEVNTDSNPPGAPQNLSLTLASNGIRATWQAPSTGPEALTYSLYRSNGTYITSLSGLTPVLTGITTLSAVDAAPSPNDHCYVVAAVDAAGNVSLPSTSFYLNFSLLPVSTLKVQQVDENAPVVTWTHPGGNVIGYDLYIGPAANRLKINSSPMTALSYTDTGFTGKERIYAVMAEDSNNAQSLGRTIALPEIKAVMSDSSRVRRGIMNRIEYIVDNLSTTEVKNIRLHALIKERDHISEPFSIGAGQRMTVPVAVGGYGDLEDTETLVGTIAITPNEGELVEVSRSTEIQVGDAVMTVQVITEEFTRGGTGKVTFSLQNTSDQEIEIVTAENSGESASSDLTFQLVDNEGNVLSTASYKQTFGEGAILLTSGITVVRIPSGVTFISDPVSIPVPASAPDQVEVRFSIANIYYHKDKPEQVKMNGPVSSRLINLIDTTYYGRIRSITPESSSGDEDIVITGEAMQRDTATVMPRVPLRLVIEVNGFERKIDVFTDTNGSFAYTFTPLQGESGEYHVYAVHPDVTENPIQGTFAISRLTIKPKEINLTMARNQEKAVEIQVSTGAVTAVNNIRLDYVAEDQVGGVYPQGVNVTLGGSIPSMDILRVSGLAAFIWADNNANQTTKAVLRVLSDEQVWGTVTVNIQCVTNEPVLKSVPEYLEIGVNHDSTAIGAVSLENEGITDCRDINLQLLNQDGTSAPSWAHLNTVADLGILGAGYRRDISLTIAPPTGTTEGLYNLNVKVTSSNHTTLNVPVHVTVTSSQVGNVLFKVKDIFTGTLNSNGEMIQGLEGAKIVVTKNDDASTTQTLVSDSLGEAYSTNLPAGLYNCAITAQDHSNYQSRFWIQPGITVNHEALLPYGLVTVNWEVVETSTKDTYTVVTGVTYKTDVPAAVIVASPRSFTIHDMEPGRVFTAEVTYTNYGMIRADNLQLDLPLSEYVSYEVLGSIPQSLGAKESFTIPIRITCLKSLSPQGENASGGAIESQRVCMDMWYTQECEDGTRTGIEEVCTLFVYGSTDVNIPGGTSTGGSFQGNNNSGSVTISVGTIIGGGGSTGGGSTGGGSTGGGSTGGGSTGGGSSGGTVGGVSCGLKRYCPINDECCKLVTCEIVGSDVDLIRGEYQDEISDIFIKVPGYRLAVTRKYYDEIWHFHLSEIDPQLEFEFGLDGMTPEFIYKDGVRHYSSDSQHKTYSFGPNRNIYVIEQGYRFEDNSGNWSTYDLQGRLTAYGNKNSIKVALTYEQSGAGRLIGILNNSDQQVLWYDYDAQGNLSAVRDAYGRSVGYAYTQEGKLSKVTDVLGHETSYFYDQTGKLSSKTDSSNETTYIEYDEFDRVKATWKSSGFRKDFVYGYDDAKQESYTRVAYKGGKIEETWFNAEGKRIRKDINGKIAEQAIFDKRTKILIDPLGNRTTQIFDEWNNLLEVTYPDGSKETYTYLYSPKGFVVSRKIDRRGITTNYEYNANGNLVRTTEAAGTDAACVTEFTYSGSGYLLSKKVLGDANTVESLTSNTYDASGNMLTMTDSEGNTTHFTYDHMGNILTKQDPKGSTWQYEYDAKGRQISITDPAGNVARKGYDARNNLIKETDAAGRETVFAYDNENRLISSTDALGNTITYEYDGDGRLVRTISPEGGAINHSYDADGRLIRTIDSSGISTSTEYDGSDQSGCLNCFGSDGEKPSTVMYPTYAKEYEYDSLGRKVLERDILSETLSYTKRYAYDISGNLISITDKEGKITRREYDSLNRLQKVIDAKGGITSLSYDDRGNMISLADPNGNTTRFEYNKNNKVIKEIRPMGQETSYAYDAAGNLTRKVDAKGQVTEYEYNSSGKVIQAMYFPTAQGAPAKTVNYTYDAVGNMLTYADGTTSSQYTYDARNRKISETVDYGSFSLSYSYTYTPNGLKKSFTGPDRITYEYNYDAGGRIKNIEIPGNGFITYNDYTWNRPATMSLPGGTVKKYTFDPLMRYTGINTDAPDSSALMDYDYSHDRMDNVQSKATEHGAYAYSYDETYQLTGADNPGAGDETYTYDAAGNRLTATGAPGTWSYNRNNELIGYGDFSFEYDANGNMVRKTQGAQVTNYVYDIDNRLIRVEDGAGTVVARYYYDPFGRRLWKEVSGTRTCFFYSEEGLIGEYTASGLQIKAYGYRLGTLWTTDPLFMKSGSQYYFYHNDHLGTPQKMTDINGAVVWSARYDSFGKAEINAASMITNNLRFPGQYNDEATGLHYNWNRYYNPYSGRYTGIDPLGFAGKSINLYNYGNNNPAISIDPEGKVPWVLAGFVAGGYALWNLYTSATEAQARADTRDFYYQLSYEFQHMGKDGLAEKCNVIARDIQRYEVLPATREIIIKNTIGTTLSGPASISMSAKEIAADVAKQAYINYMYNYYECKRKQ